MKHFYKSLLLFLVFCVTPVFSNQCYIVVVNSCVPVTSLSSGELRNIYLGKMRRWEDKEVILSAKLRSGDADRAFLENIVRKTPTQFRVYWKRAIFTGTRIPYQTFDCEDDLLDFVANTEGAIGYLSTEMSGKLPETVREITVH